MKILVTRFSALGDVAMAVPVLQAVATQNAGHDITVMSKGFCAPLFASLPSNVHFIGVDFKSQYRGLGGLRRMVRDYKVKDYDAVADLHDVLRTKYIRFYALLHGAAVACIDKGRMGRAALVRQRDKHLVQQATSFEKYAAVFRALGLACDLAHVCTAPLSCHAAAEGVAGVSSALPAVGIAPFAAHEGKIYPVAKMRRVVQLLSESGLCTVYLFGGGQKEREVLEAWEDEMVNVHSVAGRLGGLDKELDLMATLRCMLSMDSANMHLASLVNTPVVSIWGATHPLAGFMGWNQSLDNAIQLDMSCRPCSIFGNKPCLRGDYACMNGIAPEVVAEKVLSFLSC